MVYQSLLFNMGLPPGKVDAEDAEVLLDVLGAKRRQEIKYIDEV